MKNKKSTALTKNDIHDVLARFWEDVIYPELQKKPNKKDVDQQFMAVDQQLAEVRNEITQNRRFISDLQTDTPIRAEFGQLKRRVTKVEARLAN